MLVTQRITLDTATHDELQDRAEAAGRPVELYLSQLIVRTVRDTRGQVEGARTLLVAAPELQALAARLGGGDVLNGQDLVRKVERLAGISYGHVALPFTPGMLEEIAARAERMSLTPEALIERTAQKLYELFFTHLGVGVQG